ncbi:MAG TPA: hypothetical protein VF690_10695, partial [Hymenobacter sp.]
MINKLLLLGLAGGLTLATTARAQVNLGTSPYTETFDNLANGLPAGFGVYVGATTSSMGTVPAADRIILTPGSNTTWGANGAGFKNFASATGLTAAATQAEQTAATNRALGVRQTGNFGDPGAAFVFQAANTTGKTDFALTFKLQSLDNTSPRTATWRVDYGTGAAPTSFTTVGTGNNTGGSTFANNTITVNFGTALDNQSGPVFIRIVALVDAAGGG